MTVFEKIEAQQKGLEEGDTVWTVGEQLKEICEDPACAAIVAEDLENESMSIANAEKKIKEYADGLRKKKKGPGVGVTWKAADRILREFYGLPVESEPAQKAAPEEPKASAMPDLFSFF